MNLLNTEIFSLEKYVSRNHDCLLLEILKCKKENFDEKYESLNLIGNFEFYPTSLIPTDLLRLLLYNIKNCAFNITSNIKKCRHN